MAAMLIGLGVAAAVGAYKAHKESEAAKDAAATQSAAADKSLAMQKEQFDAQKTAFQPYAQNGANAANRLSLATQAPPPVFTPGQPQKPMTLADMGQPQQPQGTTPGPGAPMPMPAKLQPQGGVPQPQQPPPGAQPGLVMVQGPDGSSRRVPPPVAQQLVQSGRGFKVIAGG